MDHRTGSLNGKYENEYLDRIAFPLGGIGAGMLSLDGNGSFSNISLRHNPQAFNHRLMFGALHIKQGNTQTSRILQGRTPDWKVMFPWDKFTKKANCSSANGGSGTVFGFPYFRNCSFEARFPFATVKLSDADMPVSAELVGWSPFIPGDADNSSLPVAALEYSISNDSDEPVESVFYYVAENFMVKARESQCCDSDCSSPPTPDDAVLPTDNGFILHQAGDEDSPHREGSFAVATDMAAHVNCHWFRGGWFDTVSTLWKEIADGLTPERGPVSDDAGPSQGGSLAIPFTLAPGEKKKIRIYLSWLVPHSNLSSGLPESRQDEQYRPWCAARFKSVEQAQDYWKTKYDALRSASDNFAQSLYSGSTPTEVTEAIAGNLAILKSPTVLRQDDGRLWAWEGCCDDFGCCAGSCTHVWNYAQALPHLFPELERSLRQTEFEDCQDERGHQNFRASLPIGESAHNNHAAADGQLGGIMKIHRDWKICGDIEWLRKLWPKIQSSLRYCIETWDPEQRGLLVEPHHNTYDIEFWGADGMCSSFYLGALKAAANMAQALNEEFKLYQELYKRGRAAMEKELFNGEYFIQKIQWEGLQAPSPTEAQALAGGNIYRSPESRELLSAEGPKYQYGNGCLSDGVLGQWMAEVCGVGEILDQDKVKSHLNAVYQYNFRSSLHNHANPQRPTYALNDEAGLLLCSWPHDDRLTLPFVYSEEVWTGIEYQVASHLIMVGEREKGLEIVRAIRQRYDGRVRNPFDEYECGHWYARAMSSYSLLQGLSGARYDALEQVLYLNPPVAGDFSCFLCTATGYGQVGIRDGEPFVEVAAGAIPVTRIEISAAT